MKKQLRLRRLSDDIIDSAKMVAGFYPYRIFAGKPQRVLCVRIEWNVCGYILWCVKPGSVRPSPFKASDLLVE